jgi:hypothetical protein
MNSLLNCSGNSLNDVFAEEEILERGSKCKKVYEFNDQLDQVNSY